MVGSDNPSISHAYHPSIPYDSQNKCVATRVMLVLLGVLMNAGDDASELLGHEVVVFCAKGNVAISHPNLHHAYHKTTTTFPWAKEAPKKTGLAGNRTLDHSQTWKTRSLALLKMLREYYTTKPQAH
jgi:hypothetical protein